MSKWTEFEANLKARYDVCEDASATPSSILLAVLNAVADVNAAPEASGADYVAHPLATTPRTTGAARMTPTAALAPSVALERLEQAAANTDLLRTDLRRVMREVAATLRASLAQQGEAVARLTPPAVLARLDDDLPTVTDALALELAGMTEERDHLRSLLFGNPAGPWVPIKPEGAPYWGIRTTTGETVAGTASGLSEGDAKLICNLRAFYTGTALYPHPAAVAVDAAMVGDAAEAAYRVHHAGAEDYAELHPAKQWHWQAIGRAALTAALQPAASEGGKA